MKISNKLRSLIKSLATRHTAYCDACDKGDDNGIITWGWMLQKTQKEIGIELCRDDLIEAMMNGAIRRQAKPAREHLKSVA